MPAQILGNPGYVVGLNQAILGSAPSNSVFKAQLAQADASNARTFAINYVNTLGDTNAALAAKVLTNLGITNATLQTALEQAFAAFQTARGAVVYRLVELLQGLEGDATFGAAAATYNNAVTSNYNYAADPTSLVARPTTLNTVTLTSATDIVTGNIINAGLGFTPAGNARVNTLQDEDQITGTGTNPTLNAILGDNDGNNSGAGGTTVTPRLTGVQTLNLSFTGSSTNAVNQLDLQDSTGVTAAININRISDAVGTATVDNISSVPTNLSISNSGQPAANVSFAFKNAAVAGAADSTTLTLNDVQKNVVRVESRAPTAGLGIENITIASAGSVANTVTSFAAEDLEVLTINGAADLRLGGTGVVTGVAGKVEATTFTAGLANVAGSLTKIDASALTGKLTLNIGAEINANTDDTSGVPIQLQVLGGAGDDTFVLTQGASIDAATGNVDKIDGGAGANKLVVTGGAAQTVNAAGTAAAPVANLTKIQTLEVRTGHDDAGVAGGLGVAEVADVVTVNADAFDALSSIYIRNEGQGSAAVGVAPAGGGNVSKAEGMTVTLNNLTSAQANGITIAHGTTGNSTIANNVVNANLKTITGTADTATFNIVDGVNNDPVFNANIATVGVERVTFNDKDTESNTVHLNQGASVTTAPTAGQYAQAGSSITITGGQAGKYFSLDSFSANAGAGAATDGYGYATDGTATSSTTVAAAAAVPAGLPAGTTTGTRDAVVATVLTGAGNNILEATATRVLDESIDASTYVGDVIVRLGDITRADGFSSQNIKTFTGNDTFIFDALGLTSAGFTSGDTIAAGAGTDTLVIDGNTTTLPGTPRISIQASEWDNLTGIDALRFAQNQGVANVGNAAQVANTGGGYYARIDNEFVTQTDAGNRLTVVNNDGRLDLNSESDLVLDLRGLTQSKWITFVGANGIGNVVNANLSSNRLVVDDVSANPNMILDGGDTDIRANTTAGYVPGNNNVYEVRNTADVSINDLSQTKNFGLINFTNDAAVAQTLTLTLNNNVVEALVDASKTATSAATAEVLNITAVNNGGVASVLNIDARQVTGFHALNVTGSAGVATANDVVNLNSNVGGSGHTVNLADGTADRVNWFGGSASTTVAINMTAAGNHVFTDGAVATTHNINGEEFVDISGLTYASSAITGDAANETIIGGAGVDVINGAAGNDSIVAGNGSDTITGGTGADTIQLTETVAAIDVVVQNVGDSVATSASMFVAAGMIAANDTLTFGNGVDVVTGFQAGGLATGDRVDAQINSVFASLIGADSGALAANTTYVTRGDFVAATGVFTFNVAGNDTLLVQTDAAAAQLVLTTNTTALVLVGVTNLVAADVF